MEPIEKKTRVPRRKTKELHDDVEALIRYRYGNAVSEANERTVHAMMKVMKQDVKSMSNQDFEKFDANVQTAMLMPDRLMNSWPHDEMEEYYHEHF